MHVKDFQITPADVASLAVTSQYADSESGTTHIYLRQTVNGLPVVNADMNVSVAADGRVISAGGGVVNGLSAALGEATEIVPGIGPFEAVLAASRALELPVTGEPQVMQLPKGLAQTSLMSGAGLSLEPIPLALNYVPDENGLAVLAWNLNIQTPDNQHWYDLSVDAHTGELVAIADWTDNDSYNVVRMPNESVNDGGFSIVTNSYDPVASPFGWHDTNGVAGAEFTDTRGNNVDAHLDRDANNVPDASPPRPDGGATLDFSAFTFAPASAPTVVQNQDVAQINLFFTINTLHDVHYRYGFTEAAGNFQTNNYGRGGIGNDAVQADAQDASGTNNANFSTPTDGNAGRMQQYIWTAANPDRDSDLDNGVIAHEYGHGVSNRLTGGPANSSALNNTQSGGMGEGWGDFHGLMFMQRPTDLQNDAFGIGTYLQNQATTGPGIRRYRYSYDMSVNPLMWDAYGSSGTTSYGTTRSTEVHNTGEIWASTLWDMNWLLINKYGYDADLSTGYSLAAGPAHAGNKLTLQLVMDGMKLQPANPSFTQARDAILAADVALTGGANAFEIWSAFARRGLGANASVGTSSSTANITADTTIPASASDFKATYMLPKGTVTTTPPTSFTINATSPVTAGTIDPSLFTVNGIPATSVSYPSTTPASTLVTFEFAVSPVTSDGMQTAALSAGAFTRASDATPVPAFNASFVFDSVPLTITSTTPAFGFTSIPLTSVDLNLNEAVLPSTVGNSDLFLSSGTVTGFSLLNGNQTIRYFLSGLTSEMNVTASVNAGAFTDANGGPSLAFTGTFNLDHGVRAFPVLTAVAPMGSQVYRNSMTGFINAGADQDDFTISLEAGQRLSMLVTPSSGLKAVATVLSPSLSVENSLTALTAGQSLSLPLVATVTGVYTLRVESAGGTTGTFTVQAMLNAQVESESAGGAANNSLAAAETLSDAVTVTPLGSSSRASVVGTTDAPQGYTAEAVTPTFTSIATTGTKNTVAVGDDTADQLTAAQLSGFAFPFYGTVYTSLFVSTNGLITFNSADPANEYSNTDLNGSPATPAIAVLWDDLAMDGTGTGTSSRNIFWQVNGSGDNQQLVIQWNLARRISGSTTFTFQAVLSEDGTIQFNYASSVTTAVVQSSTVGVKAAGTTDPSRQLVSFNQAPGSLVGASKSTLLTPMPAGADYFAFTLGAGETASVALAKLSTGNLELDIRDSADTVVASGLSVLNLAQVVNNFTASPATYYARVSGDASQNYSLSVLKNAVFDSESNSTALTAQAMGASRAAYGHVTSGAANDDWFSITLPVEANGLQLQTVTPGDGTGEFVNNLDPLLRLYDATGNTQLATGTALPDGRNESIAINGLTGGTTYTIRISAPSTAGEYVLGAKAVIPAFPSVADVEVNGGDTQRSRVTVIDVTFDDEVSIAPGAFSLSNGSVTLTSAPGGGILIGTVLVGSDTVATLTFDSLVAGVDYGSLSDGNWTLTVLATAVTATANNQPMAANYSQPGIKRLFGDINGDGTVDGSIDFPAFGNEFNVLGPNSPFDFNNDGIVDGAIDFPAFGANFNVTL